MSTRTPPAPATLKMQVVQEVMGRRAAPPRLSHWTVRIDPLPPLLPAHVSTLWAVCSSIMEPHPLTPPLMALDLLLPKITGRDEAFLRTAFVLLKCDPLKHAIALIFL